MTSINNDIYSEEIGYYLLIKRNKMLYKEY